VEIPQLPPKKLDIDVMKIQEIANSLCGPSSGNDADFKRAASLYSFQVGIFTGFNSRLMQDARLLAYIRLLEFLERQADVSPETSFADRLAIPGYEAMFHLILHNGGWRRIRTLWSAKHFDKYLEACKSEAREAAKFVDFSFRSSHSLSNPRHKGGFTMALAYLKVKGYSDGMLKQRWRTYKPSVVFQYLMLTHKLGARPPASNKKRFVDKLLVQSRDSERWIAFFAAYLDVGKILRPAGYECENITLGYSITKPPKLVPPELSTADREFLKNYKSS
jgi:hypothetical protein